MRQPKIESRYVGEELALFWINPWSGLEEKIATFWWPGHPVEETARVEEWFEGIARRACLGSGLPIDPEFLKSRLGPTVADQLASIEEIHQLLGCLHGVPVGTWCTSCELIVEEDPE